MFLQLLLDSSGGGRRYRMGGSEFDQVGELLVMLFE